MLDSCLALRDGLEVLGSGYWLVSSKAQCGTLGLGTSAAVERFRPGHWTLWRTRNHAGRQGTALTEASSWDKASRILATLKQNKRAYREHIRVCTQVG